MHQQTAQAYTQHAASARCLRRDSALGTPAGPEDLFARIDRRFRGCYSPPPRPCPLLSVHIAILIAGDFRDGDGQGGVSAGQDACGREVVCFWTPIPEERT